MLIKSKSVEAFDGLGDMALRNFMSGSGMPVNYDTALQDATVKACIRVIAQTISTLPLKLYKKQQISIGKDWVVDDSSLMSHVLTVRPNVRQTSVEFVEQMITQLMLFSEYYAIIKRSPSGKIISVVPFNSPKQVSCRESGDNLIFDCVTNDGKSVQFKNDEIFHLRDLSINTYSAIDKVNLAKSSIGLSLAATNNAEQYYKRGPRAGAFIQADGKLNDDTFARLQRQFNDAYSGHENAHKIAILENGMKYVQNPYSLKDAQVLESRNAAIREIASIFGVPVTLLGISDPNLKDVESINQFFYKSCLQSIITKIEARFRLMLPRDYSLKFDLSDYLKGDIKTTAEVTKTLLERGIISVNEARSRMGMQPIMDKELFVVDSNNLTFAEWKDLEKIQSAKSPMQPNSNINTNIEGENETSS
ncbi:phage portal protein [Vibrio parahaemolyticus]|nr:phage portal protein [Vibrio parahaemolyticus]